MHYPLQFDYQSTTPCEQKVLDSMKPYWNELYGNPSSRQNRAGLQASAAINNAREKLSELLKVSPERVVFTSGATEANNLALLGYARAIAQKSTTKPHLITVQTEHHAVLDPLRQLEREGFDLTEIPPSSDGIISTNQLKNTIRSNTILVSIMLANNEIGVLQPIQQLSKICRQKNIIFHSDVAQAIGQIPFNIDQLGIDMLTISSHKIYGPKGIGALILKPNIPILPLQWGGGQEYGLRPGTLPVPLVVGFVKACELSMDNLEARQSKIQVLRDQLCQLLIAHVPELIVNGCLQNRLPNNLNFSIPGIRGTHLHQILRPLLVCSSGSACNNGEPSHVLKAIGRTKEESEASLRLSLGRHTTYDEIIQVSKIIAEAVRKLKS